MANIIERSIVLSQDAVIEVDVLPSDIRQIDDMTTPRGMDQVITPHSSYDHQAQTDSDSIVSPFYFDYASIHDLPLKDQVNLFKKHAVMNALRIHNQHQADSAEALGIRASNLSRLMKDLGLRTSKINT